MSVRRQESDGTSYNPILSTTEYTDAANGRLNDLSLSKRKRIKRFFKSKEGKRIRSAATQLGVSSCLDCYGKLYGKRFGKLLAVYEIIIVSSNRLYIKLRDVIRISTATIVHIAHYIKNDTIFFHTLFIIEPCGYQQGNLCVTPAFDRRH